MDGFNKSQMWAAIERLATISHSVASNNQRIVAKAFKTAQTIGMSSLEPPTRIVIRHTIEDTSGKIFHASA